MERLAIHPESERHWLDLRTQDLTSTDVAALFGLSPYATAFELWHAKRDQSSEQIKDNDRMLWGRRLQDAIAAGIAEDQGLIVRPMTEYMRLPAHRIGSSFDWAIEGVQAGSAFERTFSERGPGILEIKNVDWLAFRNGWVVEDGFIEAPAHIEVQTQHQQLVSGRRWSIIGALVGGNRYELLERHADDAVHAGILARASEFWQSIADNRAPDPVMPDDAQAVIRMHQFAEPGRVLDARGDARIATLLSEYHRLRRESADLSELADVMKAELLPMIGEAEKVITDVGTVSAGMVGPTTVTYERKGYRNFRFTPKKVAAQQAAE